MSGDIRLEGTEVKLLKPFGEGSFADIDEPPELVILELIHEHGLVFLVSLISKEQDTSQWVQNSAFFIVVVDNELLRQDSGDDTTNLFVDFKTDAGIQGSFEDGVDELLIIDEKLVIDADFIQETRGTYLLIEMLQDIWNVPHQNVLCLHVIETKQSKVLINGEEQPPMYLGNLRVPHQLNIADQGDVDALSHVQLLEEAVVPFSLVVEVVDDVLIEDLFLDVH